MRKSTISAAASIAMAVIPAAAQEPLVFDEPVQLDSVPLYGRVSGIRLASDSPTHWIAAWPSAGGSGGLGSDYDLLLSHTYDAGLTWSAPVPLNNDAQSETASNAGSLQITANNEGIWVAAWTRYSFTNLNYEILFARSQDGGLTWSDPQTLADQVGALRKAPDPLLAADGDETFMLLWSRREYSVSTDGGKNWSAPANVPYGEGVLEEVENLIAAGPGAFLTFAFTDDGVVVARTADAGTSWSPVKVLVSAERRPRLGAAHDGDGNIVVVWTDHDLMVARSSDGGVTWSEAERLFPDSNGLDTFRTKGEMIQVATDGTDWMVILNTDELVFGISRDHGQTWEQVTGSEPLEGDGQLFHLMGGRGAGFAMAQHNDRLVFVSSYFDGNGGWQRRVSLFDGLGVAYPRVAAGGNGQWGAVWRRTRVGHETELYAALTANHGSTWSEPRLVFETTSRSVRYPRIVAGSEGHWAVVFQSAESARSDHELQITHSFDNAATWSEPLRFDDGMSVYSGHRVEVTSSTSGLWLATWIDRQIRSITCVSPDEGRSWSTPRAFPPNADGRRIDVVAMPDGSLLMAWLLDRIIHLAASTDGESWSELPHVTPEGDWPYVYSPNLSVDPTGRLLLSYGTGTYSPVDGEGSIFYYERRSVDGGLTWAQATRIPAGFTYVLNLGPDDWLAGRYQHLWRSTQSGEWLPLEGPISNAYVAADGHGHFMAATVGFDTEFVAIETMHFRLSSAGDVVPGDSSPGSQDGGQNGTGPAPPSGLPCPLATVVLLAAGPAILLTGRRGRVR